jgi:hypothetical protein
MKFCGTPSSCWKEAVRLGGRPSSFNRAADAPAVKVATIAATISDWRVFMMDLLVCLGRRPQVASGM